MRFIAIARFSCASRLIEPNDIAPVEKRVAMDEAGSTSSTDTGSSASTKRSRSRGIAVGRLLTSSAKRS